MQINKVIINNFRNINHAEYELKKLNTFKGPNATGKTNSILAIYWALADCLFDGSSDIASIKPIGNEKELVSVELTFSNDFKFRKEFKENWVKTRGSDTLTMSGHVTNVYINDVKSTVTEGKKALLEQLGLADVKCDKKLDIIQAMINPYYLGSIDWKVLRKFIIDIVGDVSDEDIIKLNSDYESIKDLMVKHNGDTSKMLKEVKQTINLNKTEVNNIENQIKGLASVADVGEEDLSVARSNITRIESMITSVKNGNGNNLKIQMLQQQIDDKIHELNAIRIRDQKLVIDTNNKYQDELNKITEDGKAIKHQLDELGTKESTLTLELNTLKNQLDNKQIELSGSQKRLDELRIQYKEIKAEQPPKKPTVKTVSCPNCGTVLNEEVIQANDAAYEEILNKFNESIKNRIDDNIRQGKDLKAKIESINAAITELSIAYETKKIELETFKSGNQLNDLTEKYKAKQKEYSDIYVHMIDVNYKSEESVNLEKIVLSLQNELAIENRATNADQDEKIYSLMEEKKKYEDTIGAHLAYETNRKQISKLEIQMKNINDEMIKSEQKQIMIENFIQDKLNLFKKKLSDVFTDRIKFTLIESNIKEGSWNEVCYFSVLDKDTEFIHGSGSEQIKAGIYLIQRIRSALGLQDVPYIFDECDKLDNNSLANLDTDSQIITTMVDDENYTQVTLVTK